MSRNFSGDMFITKDQVRQQRLDELIDMIRDLSDETVLYHQAAAEKFGLNATDTKTASLLRKMGPVPAGVIAERLGLTAGAVTNIIDRLEHAGFVRRKSDPKDRRKTLVELVPKKIREASKVYTSMSDAFLVLSQKYSDKELELLFDYFEKAKDILHEETLKLRS